MRTVDSRISNSQFGYKKTAIEKLQWSLVAPVELLETLSTDKICDADVKPEVTELYLTSKDPGH